MQGVPLTSLIYENTTASYRSVDKFLSPGRERERSRREFLTLGWYPGDMCENPNPWEWVRLGVWPAGFLMTFLATR